MIDIDIPAVDLSAMVTDGSATLARTLPISLPQFRALAQQYDLIPVAREILFDTNTAVTAYAKLRDGRFAFLLESVVGGEKWARYTFLGSAPREALRAVGGTVDRWTPAGGWQAVNSSSNPLDYLEQRLSAMRVAPVAGLPRFHGGAVGYFAYDVVRYIEQLPHAPPDDLALPEALFIFTDTMVAIDNLFGRAVVIALAEIQGEDAPARERMASEAYAEAEAKIDAIVARLGGAHDLPQLARARVHARPHRLPASTYSQPMFEAHVERIRDYIKAGDAFQVVLSQRLAMPFEADPLDAYRVLRSLNPSPYLYLLELDGVALVGSSPEVLVRAEDRHVVVRPIAGTRKRGANDEEDERLTAELLADEKERAEHLMLVDLGRNDIGRVARFGSVRVNGLMQVERYSHVLHIVTQVEAELRDGLSAVDVFRACFPAGTVSGAPKVRAMQIIDELEPTRRGPYAGAVGYFSYGGRNMDTAIAIRTLVIAGGMAYVQAGAGVVVDSEPAAEWLETLAKAGALLDVIAAVG